MTKARIDNAARRIAAAFICAILLLAAIPGNAFADYSNTNVKTIAQVRTDASMHVVKQCTYQFEDAYSAIVWPFTGITDKQQVSINTVRITQIDDMGTVVKNWVSLEGVPFQSDWRELVQSTEGLSSGFDKVREDAENISHPADKIMFPRENTYAFDSRQNNLYIFLGNTDHNTIIECDYVVSDAVLVYNDTAEIYWDYVSPQQDVKTVDVSAQIQLPLPDGSEIVPGETILAWGHGPEGSLTINVDGTINYTVPEVLPGQYAQAHVLFPKEWLSNIPVTQKLANKGMRQDDALREEASWVDSYSMQRINELSIDAFFFALCVVVLVLAVALFIAFGREVRPSEARAGEGRLDEANLHPNDKVDLSRYDRAVIDRLLRWNRSSAKDFTTTVKGLVDKGVLQVVEDASNAADVRFRLSPSAKQLDKSELDQETLKIIFDIVGEGYQSVALSAIETFCAQRSGEMRNAMRLWQAKLDSEVASAGFFDKKSRKVAKALGIVAVVAVILGVIVYLGGKSLPGIAVIVAGVIVGVMAGMTPRRTKLGTEVAEAAMASEADSGDNDQAGVGENGQAGENRNAEWEDRLTAAIERGSLG